MIGKASETRQGKNRRESISAAQVVEWLRDGIRDRRFVPGQRLVEADITRETGASRSKVREALQRLESEGLVLIEEFKGASVRRIPVEEIEQIYRARVALEGISARDFAAKASDAELDRLAVLLEEMEAAAGEGAHDRFKRLNSAWHALIMDGSRNAVIADLLGRLGVPIQRLLFESFYNNEHLREANAGHAAVTQALLARNGEAAEAAMRQHIEGAFATMSLIEQEFRSTAPGLR